MSITHVQQLRSHPFSVSIFHWFSYFLTQEDDFPILNCVYQQLIGFWLQNSRQREQHQTFLNCWTNPKIRVFCWQIVQSNIRVCLAFLFNKIQSRAILFHNKLTSIFLFLLLCYQQGFLTLIIIWSKTVWIECLVCLFLFFRFKFLVIHTKISQNNVIFSNNW